MKHFWKEPETKFPIHVVGNSFNIWNHFASVVFTFVVVVSGWSTETACSQALTLVPLARDTSQLKGEQRREIENPCELNGGNDQVIKTVKTRQSTDNDEEFYEMCKWRRINSIHLLQVLCTRMFWATLLIFLINDISILLLLLSLIIILILLSSSTSSLVNYTYTAYGCKVLTNNCYI